jgi:type IV pilus assembly protein PilW
MRHHSQRGFTIVEIMVAVTLSLIVLAGVLAVMYSSRVTYNENERVGRNQENGRAAMELMLRDLRGAGFPGCAQPIAGLFDLINLLDDSTEVAWNLGQPAYGFEGSSGTWTPALDATLIPNATEDNDIIVVRTIPVGSPSMRVTAQVTSTTSISVSKDVGEMLEEGSPAVISDCGHAAIFAVSDFTGNAEDTTATIAAVTGGSEAPTNSSTDLAAVFNIGARVAPIVSVAYYVAPNSADTGPSLWRVIAGSDPQELVPGVEAMQLQYGVDTSADGMVDEYVDANAVTDWANVVSVTLALLVRSAEQNALEVDSREYSLLGTDVGPFNDHFERSLFTTTVTLRNRTT